MSQARKGKSLRPAVREKISFSLKAFYSKTPHPGHPHSGGWKRAMSERMKGHTISDETKRKISEKTKGHLVSSGTRERIRLGLIKACQEGRRKFPPIPPTKPELALTNILDKYFPNEWRYVGDGKVVIEGLNPDFINSNGSKAIIELFGAHWHSKGDRVTLTEEGRRGIFAKYGYKLLVFWENEIKDEEYVVRRVKQWLAT